MASLKFLVLLYKSLADASKTKTKMVKPCTRFQSQRHVKAWPTFVASLMLIACLVVEIIHNADFVCLCRPTVTLHQGQGHRNEHGHIYAMCESTGVMPRVNVIA